MGREELPQYLGDYQGGREDDVIFLYAGATGLAYVDHVTGRVGRLFPAPDGTFFSGPSVIAAFPVELTASFERDVAGRVVAVSWERRGEPARRLDRRSLYRTEPVRLRSTDEVSLSGSLLLPHGRGPHPAVVMVPGSGKVTRDTLMPYADSFARNGVAVLVHDKRGVGQSTGNYARAGIVELADDALAGVEWLTRHPAINANQIGLLGTSLGGWVAPLAATRSPDVRFIIIEAAPAVTPAEHERLRVQNQMEADRQPRESVARALAFMDRKFEVGRTGKGWDDLERSAQRGRRDGWAHYVNVPVSFDSLRWNWEHVLSYDPQPVLRRLRVPVLAIYGELDRVVEPKFNVEKMEKALRAADNRDVTVRVFPSANHNFFQAITGGPGEVAQLKAFVGGYFASRVDWLLARVDESTPVAASAFEAPGGGGALEQDRLQPQR
jgi:pimeloyl-ACP methyl ester carboxylesterase